MNILTVKRIWTKSPTFVQKSWEQILYKNIVVPIVYKNYWIYLHRVVLKPIKSNLHKKIQQHWEMVQVVNTSNPWIFMISDFASVIKRNPIIPPVPILREKSLVVGPIPKKHFVIWIVYDLLIPIIPFSQIFPLSKNPKLPIVVFLYPNTHYKIPEFLPMQNRTK